MEFFATGSAEKDETESVDDFTHNTDGHLPLRFSAIAKFWECLKESSLPGNRILAARNTAPSIKIIWSGIFLFSIILNIVGIYYVQHDWNAASDDIQTDDSKMPVWKVPFPAITICPETKANKTILNITEVFHGFEEEGFFANQTEDIQARIAAVAQVCDHFIFGHQNFNDHVLGPECVDAIKEMAVTKEEMLFYCKFRTEAGLCSTIFHEVLTGEGVCFTFNMLNASDIFKKGVLHENYPVISHEEMAHSWSMDKGYSISNLLDLYPKRALAGVGNGLFVLLRLYTRNLDYICRGPLQGFKVAVHAPNRVPRMEKHYFRVPLEQEVIATISPSVITHSDELRKMTPNERQCYFNDERDLKFFKEYTQENCELECLADYVKKHCGCVRFDMPRMEGEKICGGPDIDCVANATFIHSVSEASEELENSFDGNIGVSKCNCLPACSHIEYDITTTQAYFDWRSLFHAFKNPIDEFEPMQLSRLSIILKDNHIPVRHGKSGSRSVWILWALFGGTIAICSGISLLSILEVIYSLIVKYCQSKSRNNQPQLMSMEPTVSDGYVNI